MTFLTLGFIVFFSLGAKAENLENQLGWTIYKKSAPSGNVILSPASLYSTFAFVFEGSEGKTKETSQKFLLLAPNAKKNILPPYLEPMNNLRKNPDFKLQNSYSFWHDESVKNSTPSKEYKNFVDKNYQADWFEADFKKADTTTKKINDWVKTKTNSLIPSIATPDTLNGINTLVLNAVYFKARWQTIFDVKSTQQGNFYSSANIRSKAEFMNNKSSYSYFEDDKLQYIELPYKGSEVYIAIVLPKNGTAIAELEKKLNSEIINSFSKSAQIETVKVSLPRFKFDWTSPVNFLNHLESMGMPTKGNFTPMGFLELEIRKVIHKATIINDENGTEAAAVTAVGGFGTTSVPPEPKIFEANRPFLFVIKMKSTDTWLFLGRVEKP
jgi:serpin B